MEVLERTLKWIALGGVFAVPFIVLLVTESLFFPFITGKNFAFRIIVEVAAGAWLALALVNPAYRPRRTWLLGAFALFVLIIAAADTFGVNAFKSFWSNFERMDGWVTLVHLFAYFVVTSALLSTEKLWRAYFYTTLGVSAVVGMHALFQLFGIASLNPGFSSTTRLDASFGNPIYLAVYMLFHVFIAALTLVQMNQGNQKRSPLFWVVGGVLALDTLVLFLTGTRGAILGLLGGVILAALLFAWKSDSQSVRRVAIGFIATIVVLAGGVYLARDTAAVQGVSFLHRLTTISVEDNTTKARIMNWGMAWEGFKERPILGWGQENYAIVFSKYYNPQMYGQEQWFDRVHNVIFDWLVAGGVLGLLAYLSLFGLSLWYLWRRDLSTPAGALRAGGQKEEDSRHFTLSEKSILTGLLVAYVFQNLFVFDNVMSYVLFALVLSYIAYRAGVQRDVSRILSSAHVSKRALPIVAVFIIVVVWGTAWYVNAKPLAANRTLLSALTSQNADTILENFNKALSYDTMGTQETREQLIQVTTRLASIEGISIELKQRFLEKAAQEMILQSERSPLDPRPLLFLGSMLDTYGLHADAETILKQALERSPTKQTIMFAVAENARERGEVAEALGWYKQAFELAPDFREARLRYAVTLIQQGQASAGVELIEEYLRENPSDAEAGFTLAAAYYEAGNAQAAIQELQRIAEANPDLQNEAAALIQQVRSGTPIE